MNNVVRIRSLHSNTYMRYINDINCRKPLWINLVDSFCFFLKSIHKTLEFLSSSQPASFTHTFIPLQTTYITCYLKAWSCFFLISVSRALWPLRLQVLGMDLQSGVMYWQPRSTRTRPQPSRPTGYTSPSAIREINGLNQWHGAPNWLECPSPIW